MQLLKLKNIGFSLILCASVLVIFSCGEDEDPPETTCETEGLTYGNFAKDFIDQTCATSGCHDGEVATSMTFGMIDYESTKTAVDFGKIIGSINHQDGFSNMPRGEEKLDDCSIMKMTAWINDGAPE